MAFTERALGVLILVAAFAAMLCMAAYHYRLVAKAAIQDAREEARREAVREADRRYRDAIRNADIRVKQQVRLVNESDINWGDHTESKEEQA